MYLLFLYLDRNIRRRRLTSFYHSPSTQRMCERTLAATCMSVNRTLFAPSADDGDLGHWGAAIANACGKQ